MTDASNTWSSDNAGFYPSQDDFRNKEIQKILEGLNPPQQQAVEHRGSPLLIIAGAGSGKTTVLTRRIAHILLTQPVRASQIMAITFTNKAAAEMRERVAAAVGEEAVYMWVSTFHSMCVRILRSNTDLVEGITSGFSIYDTNSSLKLIKNIVQDWNLDSDFYKPESLISQISKWKSAMKTPEEVRAASSFAYRDNSRRAEIYQEYQRRLRDANALDFDDLIGETVRLLTNYPEVAQGYRRRFRHIMVDEYQDTNVAQYQLIRALVCGGKDFSAPELCVVGDADQSIYAFRGATIRNIDDFESDFPHARVILLEQNYRSTQNILTAANAVITHNEERREKKLWTAAGEGEKISLYVADNEQDEASYIAQQIRELVKNGTSYSDIAICYRTNSCSRVLEDAVSRIGVPYALVGGTRFYERAEIHDILAYLRVINNPYDTVSLQRIINVPRRKIGDRTQVQLLDYANQYGCSLWQAAEDVVDGSPFSEGLNIPSAARNSLAQFVQLMRSFQERAQNLLHADTRVEESDLPALAQLVKDVIHETGYWQMVKESRDVRAEERQNNLDELITNAAEFSKDVDSIEALARELSQDLPEGKREKIEQFLKDHPDQMEELLEGRNQPGSLSAFLEKVSLVADTDKIPSEEEGAITLMSLHAAKGLEFPVVFIVGWEQGIFPHKRALESEKDIEEERRLAYVGITRAKEKLYLSRALGRTFSGKYHKQLASCFLSEIPEELVDSVREEPQFFDEDYYSSSRNSFYSSGGYQQKKTSGSGRYRDVYQRHARGGRSASSASSSPFSSSAPFASRSTSRSSLPTSSALHLEVGERVLHDRYGMGKVVELSGEGQRSSALIDFGSKGVVRMLLMGAPIQKL